MFKKCLLILISMAVLPIFAGEVENSLNQGHNVFLYLYSSQCGYCKLFAPKFNKLAKMYDGQYNFYKYNVETQYGHDLFVKYRGHYVPYVLLINNKKAVNIHPNCLSDMVCIEKEMKLFRK